MTVQLLSSPTHGSSPLALPSPSLVHWFQDVDAFGQMFYQQGLALTQLDTGRFEGSVIKLQIEDLQLLRLTANASLYTLGPKPPDTFTFSLSLAEPQGPFISHKQALSPQVLFGFDPNREVSLITPEQMQIAIVLVPRYRLDRYLHDVDRDDLDAKFFQQNAVQLDNQRLGDLRAYLNQIFYLADTNPDVLTRWSMTSPQGLSPALILGDLLPLLVNSLSTDPPCCTQVFSRAAMVQAAEAFMQDNLDRPLTLEAICQSIKTSKSALSYGFHDIFGLSPMAYLKTVRLHGVRRALRTSDPTQATVLGIANDYGFWHMGHFAKDYRRMFGESPSDTLRSEG